MHGGSSDYVQDSQDSPSRPPKRPRNVSSSGEYSQPKSGLSPPHVEEQIMGLSIADPFRVGRSDAGSSTGATTTMNRGRLDEKNNRKLSCKECRRLKLKCDRIFPCQSCVKRGCGSLCPDGALTSGRGSRFILAGAEQLHEKIFELGDRVRQLEDALGVMQSRTSNHTHPLLVPELLKIKTSQELYGSKGPHALPLPPLNIPSSTRDRDKDEQLRNFNALTLNCQPPYAESSRLPSKDYVAGKEIDVAADILQLSATFPFPWAVDISIRKRIRDSLPPRAEARRICEEARNNALWQFNLDASETFLPNLLHYCYETSIEALSPRRLALLLMHLSIGSLVDLSGPLGSIHGEAYHHLARAAVCEIPLMEEPDFDVLHALFFMIWFHLIFSDNKKAIGYAWNLMGFVAKLAQGLGLHRETPRLKVIPEEHEKRRAVFWELLNMDCRMALSLGRPPSMSLAHVDVKPPTFMGPGLYVPREEIVYHEWKNAFFIQCLTPMLETMVSVRPTDYDRIIILDKSVRDFGVPSLLDDHHPHDVNPRFLVLQRGLVSMSREIALLQLHRRYFTEAMSTDSFDLAHPYAPSVLATYLGASSLLSAVETLFNQQQQISVRFLHFWFNSFSAVYTLSLLISRAPSTPLATYAFQELERGCRLFRAAAQVLPFCGRVLPMMQKLLEKSQRVLLKWHGGEHSQMSYAGYPQPQPKLPPSFQKVHPLILDAAEKIESRSIRQGMNFSTSSNSARSNAYNDAPLPTSQESWLPDIYHFSTVGISVEERYTFASAKPTPFIPSSPRVAENENFNFDHGALSSDLVEETSYMVWF